MLQEVQTRRFLNTETMEISTQLVPASDDPSTRTQNLAQINGYVNWANIYAQQSNFISAEGRVNEAREIAGLDPATISNLSEYYTAVDDIYATYLGK